MAKKCIPCLSKEVKAVLGEKFPLYKRIVESIEDCGPGVVINLCGPTETRGAKRAPSAYNLFVKQCMTGKHIKGFGEAPVAMKSCAAEWREQKARR